MTKITGAVLFVVVALSAVCKGEDDTAKFRYRAAKAIPVGTVLHYVKTNVDGSRPEYDVTFGQVPVHLYNFDFASLNFAFPQLTDNPGRTSFKFKLLCVEKMSRAE